MSSRFNFPADKYPQLKGWKPECVDYGYRAIQEIDLPLDPEEARYLQEANSYEKAKDNDDAEIKADFTPQKDSPLEKKNKATHTIKGVEENR